MARLQEKYRTEIVNDLKKALKTDNIHALPRLDKIVISMGIGKAIENKNLLDAAAKDLAVISGQKPMVTRARKSVANFKLRKGQNIGLKVTLRGPRMYEFLDRLITIVIPRIRDFRGLSPRSFDQAGNYNLGISEQIVFPEINIEKLEFTQGMNITIGVKARRSGDSLELLKLLGVPFRQQSEGKPGYGEYPLEGQAEEEGEVLDSAVQSLLDLRTPPRVSSQVQDLPPVLPDVGQQGRNSGGSEGILVDK